MVAALLSRITIVLAGILYPAYSSFKAVRRKSHRDYTKWMMYWIVFALFMTVEVLTDTFLSWLPLYYEVKILFVLWLVLPITEGAKQLYRYAVHPFLLKHETELDHLLSRAGETGMSALRKFSRAGINMAATTVVSSAMKGQAVLTETLLKAQEQQQQVPSITAGSHADGADGVEREEGQRSSTASSNESEPFELIEVPPPDFTRQSSYPSLELGESSNPSALGSTLSSSSGLSQSTSNLPAVGRITRMTARQNSVPVINVEEYSDSRSRRRRH